MTNGQSRMRARETFESDRRMGDGGWGSQVAVRSVFGKRGLLEPVRLDIYSFEMAFWLVELRPMRKGGFANDMGIPGAIWVLN